MERLERDLTHNAVGDLPSVVQETEIPPFQGSPRALVCQHMPMGSRKIYIYIKYIHFIKYIQKDIDIDLYKTVSRNMIKLCLLHRCIMRTGTKMWGRL